MKPKIKLLKKLPKDFKDLKIFIRFKYDKVRLISYKIMDKNYDIDAKK